MNTRLSRRAAHVQEVLAALGFTSEVVEFATTTRTAQEAAKAIGCTEGQIVKSLVFKTRKGAEPILVLASGSTRVDTRKLRVLVNAKIGRADADFVRLHSGYAIGGVAPVGHPVPLRTLVDRTLLQHEQLWAAAGTPHAVFSCTPAFLAGLGEIADLKVD